MTKSTTYGARRTSIYIHHHPLTNQIPIDNTNRQYQAEIPIRKTNQKHQAEIVIPIRNASQRRQSEIPIRNTSTIDLQRFERNFNYIVPRKRCGGGGTCASPRAAGLVHHFTCAGPGVLAARETRAWYSRTDGITSWRVPVYLLFLYVRIIIPSTICANQLQPAGLINANDTHSNSNVHRQKNDINNQRTKTNRNYF